MKTTKPTPKKKAQSKPKPKPKEPKPRIEPKWDKPEKFEDVPKTYLEQKPKMKSNQELMDTLNKIHESDENLIKKNRAEKIATFSITALVIVLLFWLWSFSESKNKINKMEAAQESYQFQVDSLNQVVGDLQANLQTALDTLHNNSSKIPE
jgi:type VI protein secretion system component VasK